MQCTRIGDNGLSENLLPYLAGILVLGVASQWFAWRVGLPSILLLLVLGVVAGPVSGWLNPDAVFKDLLFPVVSLSVAVILYEGGLTLRMRELRQWGGVVRNLVTIGALVTWVVGALAASLLLGTDFALSVLLGAVLVVTGPTVIAPLLRFIRPTGPVGPLLKWEGVVIDPIGALLAVLVFEAIVIGEAKMASMHVVVAVFKTVLLGGGLGFTGAVLFTLLSYRRWIGEHLENAVSLMLVVAVFSVSNHFQHESGLLAVIVMGFVLANQRWVDVEHLIEFKENLRVLLISSLFIVLAARIDAEEMIRIAPKGLAFVAVLIFVGRPLSVWVATLGSELSGRERLFLAWMAPRGIVAAAVSSVFAIRLEEIGHTNTGILVPVTFLTIITTVAVYGLTASAVARKLGLAESNPQGILFVGAQAWVRHLAALLKREGFRVLIVDNNRDHTYAARMADLPTYTGSILAEHTLDEIELGGIGRLVAATPNDWVNVLAVQRFQRVFGKANCYQLAPQQDPSKTERHRYLHGRLPFGAAISNDVLERRVTEGWEIKATRLSDEFDFDALVDRYGDDMVPLITIDEKRSLLFVAPDAPLSPVAGETIISIVKDGGSREQR